MSILDLLVAIVIASTLTVGLGSVASRQRRLEALAAEKLYLFGVAGWAAREVLAAPPDRTGPTVARELEGRMASLGLPGPLGYELSSKPIVRGVREVTVTVTRRHPELGRVGASAVVIIGE